MQISEKVIYWHRSVCVHPPGPATKSPPDHHPGRLTLLIKIRKEPDSDSYVKVPVLRWEPRKKLPKSLESTPAHPNQSKEYIEELTGAHGERQWCEVLTEDIEELKSVNDSKTVSRAISRAGSENTDRLSLSHFEIDTEEEEEEDICMSEKYMVVFIKCRFLG